MEKEINLTFKREEFEKIYFKNDKGNLTKSAVVRNYWRGMLTCLGIALLSIVFAYITDKGVFVMTMSIVVFLISALLYVTIALSVFRWKENVHLYLDRIEEEGDAKVILTETTFTLVNDKRTILTKWDSFTSIAIEPDYIKLYAHESYLFPKGSMSEEELDFLTSFAMERINNPNTPLIT